jgi:SAM-dependent methyltransferase
MDHDTDHLPEPRQSSAVTPSSVRPFNRPLVWLFAAASFCGAALVFLVQPMVAKMILPRLGGSPAVWNTSLVFFQALLLAGYAYAHLSFRVLGARRQPILHMAILLLPLAVLPVALPEWTVPNTEIELWVLGLLAAAAGAPYFAIASAGPLLQRWFSTTNDPDAGDPYFLYAAGNAGSVAGLLAYPFLLEPNLPLGAQSRVWAGGYILFIVLAGACALALLRSRPAGRPKTPEPTRPPALAEHPNEPAAPPEPALAPEPSLLPGPSPLSHKTRLRWVGLAFLPSSLLLGSTTYLSTDVAAVPLLWVVPLALYLGTFILAFSRSTFGFAAWFQRWLPLLVLPAALAVPLHLGQTVLLAVVIHLTALFAVGAAAHSRLAEERPPVDRLTEFYLLISVGGVAGGLFNALLAPLLFDALLEYPLVLVLSLLAARLPPPLGRRVFGLLVGMTPAALAFMALGAAGSLLVKAGILGTWTPVPAIALLLAAGAVYRRALPFARVLLGGLVLYVALLPLLRPALHAERTFFGTHRVAEADGWHLLSHGTTVHGAQSRDRDQAGEPATYYHRDGPAGDIMATRSPTDRMAFVGLGTGALAAYAEPGQSATFFEIDPAVVRIAQDTTLFSYLNRSRGEIRIVLGDGRQTLALEPSASFDLIVLDAFTSDAIPVHLLTLEAVEMYLERLRPRGILAFHVSNRYVDLEPVLGRVAQALELEGRVRFDEGDGTRARNGSRWIVLAESVEALGPLSVDHRWTGLRVAERGGVWTDDYSNILRALRFW